MRKKSTDLLHSVVLHALHGVHLKMLATTSLKQIRVLKGLLNFSKNHSIEPKNEV